MMMKNLTSISENKFVIMPEQSKMEPIFNFRQLIEKCRTKKKVVSGYYWSEEGRVIRVIFKWSLMMKSFPKIFININEEMYAEASTRVKSTYVWRNCEFLSRGGSVPGIGIES